MQRAGWAERCLYVLAAVAFALGTHARIVPAWDTVFRPSGEVFLLDSDSYYHLRHTEFAVEHFPRVQRWDVGTNYPVGERSPHAGLFHVLLAGVCLVFGGTSPSRDLIASVLAVSPVLLYLIAALLLFRMVRAMTDARLASFAIAGWSLFPGLSFARTLLGFADHHAAEIVLSLATLLGLRAALLWSGGSRWLRLGHAVPLLLFQFTWSGAPLVLGLVVVSLVVGMACDLLRDGHCTTIARIARDWGALLALGLTAVRFIAPSAIMIERLLLPSLAVSGALFASGVVASRLRPAGTRQRRIAVAGLLGAGAVAAGVVFWRLPPEFSGALFAAKTAVVQEHRGISATEYLSLQGLVGLLGLVALPVCWLAARRFEGFRAQLVCAVFASGVTAGWLVVHDHGYLAAPLLALASSLTISAGAWLLNSSASSGLLSASIAAAALQIWPLNAAANPFAAEPKRLQQIDDAWSDAMRWLSSSTPTPRPAVDARVPGWPGGSFAFGPDSYGVLTAWDFGNIVSVLGRRVPLSSHNFSRSIAQWLLTPDEATSLQRLCPACEGGQSVRFVVLSAPTLAQHFVTNWNQTSQAGAERTAILGYLESADGNVPLVGYGPVYDESIGVRLYAGGGNGLRHYRLVFQSEQLSWSAYQRSLGDAASSPDVTRVSVPLEDERAVERALGLRQNPLQPVEIAGILRYGHTVTASVKIFEVVRGARITGKAWPGSSLQLFLGLAARGQRLFVYSQMTRADADGAFEMTLPYPSEGGTSSLVQPDAPMQVLMKSADGAQHATFRVDVSEEAVRRGADVRLGDVTGAR